MNNKQHFSFLKAFAVNYWIKSIFSLMISKINTLFNVSCEGSGCPFFLARG